MSAVQAAPPTGSSRRMVISTFPIGDRGNGRVIVLSGTRTPEGTAALVAMVEGVIKDHERNLAWEGRCKLLLLATCVAGIAFAAFKLFYR